MDNFPAYFSGKRILITGANGFLATNLIQSLKDTDCTIMRLSRGKRLLPVKGVANIVDVTGDIRTPKLWEQVVRDMDIIYHFAAQTSVYIADKSPIDDLEVNVIPILNLLETCRLKEWNPIIIFSGTVTELGIPKKLPVDETQKDYPIAIYDIHKLMAENYLRSYSLKGIVSGTTLRLANVYGPGPKSSNADRGVLNMMISKALAGEPLTIYGKGEYLRDYLYIEDVVNAFLNAAMYIDRLNGKYFVIGSSEGTTIAQAINLVADRVSLKTGKRAPVKHIAPPSTLHPIEFRNFVADPNLFIDYTDWKIDYSLIKGIDDTINYFRKQ